MADKLGLEEARTVVEAMLAEAKTRDLIMAAAVVDAGGDLIYLARMDGASALNARMSHHKAYTATKWQRDTRAIKERLFDMSLGENRREINWFGDPMYTPVWGGILLKSSAGAILGAVGESGAAPEVDEEIGQVGAAVFAKL
jgi:uncharacterized protein GlcG (DUF336 family)